MSRRTSINKAC